MKLYEMVIADFPCILKCMLLEFFLEGGEGYRNAIHMLYDECDSLPIQFVSFTEMVYI